MAKRPQRLQDFIDSVRNAVRANARRPDAVAAGRRIFDALDGAVGSLSRSDGTRLPACAHFERALRSARAVSPEIAGVADAFETLEPSLTWVRRAGCETHGEAFTAGHANTWIVGPAGVEQRADVIIGASLLAPDLRYPEHHHPPQELYVVMSEGDWFNREDGWYTPGPGAIVYHRSNISHAMRSGGAPLLAVWCLAACRT